MWVISSRRMASRRSRVHVRAAIAKGGRAADVFLPEKLLPKLRRLWAFKRQRTEILAPDAPVFCSQSGRRISKRRVQTAWCTWQEAAGFDRHYPFHALRHTAVTSIYRASRNLFLAQRFARHAVALDDDRLHASVGRGTAAWRAQPRLLRRDPAVLLRTEPAHVSPKGGHSSRSKIGGPEQGCYFFRFGSTLTAIASE